MNETDTEKVIDNKLAETYNYIYVWKQKVYIVRVRSYISEMLMETGEIPVQCRCCVGGVFFIMPLEQVVLGRRRKRGYPSQNTGSECI